METVFATLRDKKRRAEWDDRETLRKVIQTIGNDDEKKQPAMLVEIVRKHGIPKLGFAVRCCVVLSGTRRIPCRIETWSR